MVDGRRLTNDPTTGDADRSRVERAIESVEDAITLLEWRYPCEAGPSVARLQEIREELRLALLLEASSPTLH